MTPTPQPVPKPAAIPVKSKKGVKKYDPLTGRKIK